MAKTTVLPRALVSWAALALASWLAGCGPSVPAAPTYEANVRPILAVHCFGCHGNAASSDGAIYDPPPADTPPGSEDPKTALTVQRAYLDQCTSTGCDMDGGGAGTCRRGAQYFATTPPAGATSGNILSDAIHGGEGFVNPMPPPPAAALDDWEMKVLNGWIANPVCGSDAGP
jgi:hypothetical protein